MLLTIDHNLNSSNLGLSAEHLNWVKGPLPWTEGRASLDPN